MAIDIAGGSFCWEYDGRNKVKGKTTLPVWHPYDSVCQKELSNALKNGLSEIMVRNTFSDCVNTYMVNFADMTHKDLDNGHDRNIRCLYAEGGVFKVGKLPIYGGKDKVRTQLRNFNKISDIEARS